MPRNGVKLARLRCEWYVDFETATGYGTGEGLGGWNCRHGFYPFWPGLSVRNYTDEQLAAMNEASVPYNGKLHTRYEINQMQRALERKVRSAKRKYLAESEAGVDASRSAVWLKAARQQLSEFIRTTGGRADSSRASVAGFGRSAASKANWASIPIAGGGSTKTKYRSLTGAWSIDRHLSAVNPKYKSGDPRYQQNCQRCVPAYIMRLRGYDVIAKPAIVNAEGKISPKDPLGTNWHKIFKKMSRSHCVGSDGGLAEILLQFSKWENGAVAEVYIELKSGGGHVFVAQKNNGVVHFIDPQTGDGDCSRYFTEARVGATIVARVDTLQPSELIEECIKNRGGKL